MDNRNQVPLIIRTANGEKTLLVRKTETIGALIERIRLHYGIPFLDQTWAIEDRMGIDRSRKRKNGNGKPSKEPKPDPESSDDEISKDSSGDEWTPDNDEACRYPSDETWTFEKKVKVVNYYHASPGRTFESVQQRFKKIRDPKQLSRFVKEVAKSGTRNDKWRVIDEEVKKKYNEACQSMLPVYNDDLRHWALEAAGTLGVRSAISDGYIVDWKRRHGVSAGEVEELIGDDAPENVEMEQQPSQQLLENHPDHQLPVEWLLENDVLFPFKQEPHT